MEAVKIIGYPNYKIYPDGKVWSKYTNKFLIPSLNKDGYLRYGLYNNGQQKKQKIHRLLMQHFKPDEWNENLCVDHENRIRTDNRLKNLRMVTSLQNSQNSIK